MPSPPEPRPTTPVSEPPAEASEPPAKQFALTEKKPKFNMSVEDIRVTRQDITALIDKGFTPVEIQQWLEDNNFDDIIIDKIMKDLPSYE